MKPKIELRKKIRAKLAALTPEERAEKSRKIEIVISELPEWKCAKTVAFFAPMHDEPDVELLWKKIRAEKKRAVFPRIEDNHLRWFAISELSELAVSRWSLREPPTTAPITPNGNVEKTREIAISEIDLMLVPGVAFSANGERLGRGGGFYDRALANHELRAFKIGVCFDFQIEEKLPVESHDCAMDFVVSESHLSRC